MITRTLSRRERLPTKAYLTPLSRNVNCVFGIRATRTEKSPLHYTEVSPLTRVMTQKYQQRRRIGRAYVVRSTAVRSRIKHSSRCELSSSTSIAHPINTNKPGAAWHTEAPYRFESGHLHAWWFSAECSFLCGLEAWANQRPFPSPSSSPPPLVSPPPSR